MNGSLRTRWLSLLSAVALSLAGGSIAVAGGPSPAPTAAPPQTESADGQDIETIVPLITPLFNFYSDMFATPTTVVDAQQPAAVQDPVHNVDSGTSQFPPIVETEYPPPVVRTAPEPATITLAMLGWSLVGVALLRRRLIVRLIPARFVSLAVGR